MSEESLQDLIGHVDITNVSAAGIIDDILNRTNQFSFHLTVAAELLKRVQERDTQNASEPKQEAVSA
jgi:hypothetical protein